METICHRAEKARQFRAAQLLNTDYGTPWQLAFQLADGQTINGQDYYNYQTYQQNVSDSLYLFGSPSAAFRD